MQLGDGKSRQAAGYAAEARSDRLTERCSRVTAGWRRTLRGCSRNPLGVLEAQNHDGQEASDTSVAGKRNGVPRLSKCAHAMEKISGTLCIRNPKKSRICVLAIRMAMPLVKPMITGRGKHLTAVPMPVIPSSTRSTPAIIVQVKVPRCRTSRSFQRPPRQKRRSVRRFAFSIRPMRRSEIP